MEGCPSASWETAGKLSTFTQKGDLFKGLLCSGGLFLTLATKNLGFINGHEEQREHKHRI